MGHPVCQVWFYVWATCRELDGMEVVRAIARISTYAVRLHEWDTRCVGADPNNGSVDCISCNCGVSLCGTAIDVLEATCAQVL
jgi:hypothetical protein